MVDHEYEQKLALLDKILKDGLSKLLLEAKEKNFLEPPYGRMPYPTPLISEETFIQQGGIAGRAESTGLGVYFAVRELLSFKTFTDKVGLSQGIKDKTFIVQGFGAVGYWASHFI